MQLKFQKLNDQFPILLNAQNKIQQDEKIEITNSDRIVNLVNRTKEKLKLINKTPDARFNQQMQQFRILETFVDTKARLKKMNILNNRDLLESVKNYLIRRKIARQLGQEADIEKIYEQFDIQFESDFDKKFLQSNCALNFGSIRVKNLEQKKYSQEKIQEFRQKVLKHQKAVQVPITRDNCTKSQYDENLFYYNIEDQIQQSEKQKQEAENFFSQIGKAPKHTIQMNQDLIKSKSPISERFSQYDQDKELVKVALSYGIDLNSADQLEEEIYKAFKEKAQLFIRAKINEAKQKHNLHVEEDQLKMKYSYKPKTKRVSSMFEQNLFRFPKTETQDKSVQQFEAYKPTINSDNRKSQELYERLERKKEQAKMIKEFNQKSRLIAGMCKKDQQKLLYNDFIKDIQQMNTYLDETVQRTNFNRKLSQLDFSKEEQYFIKRSLNLNNKTQRNQEII